MKTVLKSDLQVKEKGPKKPNPANSLISDFQPLPRSSRQYISVVAAAWLMVLCYSIPQTNTLLCISFKSFSFEEAQSVSYVQNTCLPSSYLCFSLVTWPTSTHLSDLCFIPSSSAKPSFSQMLLINVRKHITFHISHK